MAAFAYDNAPTRKKAPACLRGNRGDFGVFGASQYDDGRPAKSNYSLFIDVTARHLAAFKVYGFCLAPSPIGCRSKRSVASA